MVRIMAIWKFMLGNLKMRKSYSIIISILVFITGLILSVTISTAQKVNTVYDHAFNSMEGPHLFYSMSKNDYRPDYMNWFRKQASVKLVRTREGNFYNGAVFTNKGKILKDGADCFIFEYNPIEKMRLIDSAYPSSKTLPKGEIYMPYVYKTMHGAKTGDKVNYVFGNQKVSFKVAGFVEEPIYGSDMGSTKQFFASGEDLKEISAKGGENVYHSVQMMVRLKAYDTGVLYKLERDFNKSFGSFEGYADSYENFKMDHLTLPKIALVVMIAFAFILSIITVTILRYSILATIEADYLNIGIIKALGFTPVMVQLSITGQYGLLALVMGVLSLIAGVFITPFAGNLVLKSSGLYFNGHMSLIAGMLTLAGLVSIISLFSYITARRTKKISPVRAIANGIAPVYFASRFSVRLEKLRILPFDMRMAIKQFMTKSKRYILLITISALLAYAMAFFLGLFHTFNNEKAISLVGGEISDIEIDCKTKAEVQKIVSQVKKDYDIEWVTYQRVIQMTMDSEKTNFRVRDDFDTTGLLQTLRGRHPKHNNEIALSVLLKKKFNKDVGDEVTITDISGKTHQFMVTGIFQSVDNGGEYARLPESGMKVLNPDFELNEAYIRLKNHDNLDSVINEMRNRYSGYEEISNDRVESEEKVNTIKSVFSAISTLVFALTAILIGFITLLTIKITLYNENRELGIFKAIGFSSARIRLQLAFRFAVVTILGGFIGVVIEVLTGARLFSMALNTAGISEFIIDFRLTNLIIPIISITFITMLAAYVSSGNTKKVSPYVLINE